MCITRERSEARKQSKYVTLKLAFPTSKSTAALLHNTSTYFCVVKLSFFWFEYHTKLINTLWAWPRVFFLLLQLTQPLWNIKGCRTIWSCSWVVTNDVRIVSLPPECYAFLVLFRAFRFVRILCWVKGIYELHQYAILVFMNLYFGNRPWSATHPFYCIYLRALVPSLNW
jgi:hypothetical protein